MPFIPDAEEISTPVAGRNRFIPDDAQPSAVDARGAALTDEDGRALTNATGPSAIPGTRLGVPVPAQAQYVKPTFGQKAKGAVEAALSTLTGLTSAMPGAIGAGLGAAAGAVATALGGGVQPQGGVLQNINEAMGEGAHSMTYQPKTETGQDYAQAVAEASRQVLEPLGPVAASLAPGVRPGMKVAQRAAEAPGQVAGAVAKAITPTISPERAGVVAAGQKQGLQFAPHQLTDNKYVKMAGETAEHLPGAFGKMRRDERQDSFNQALIRQINPEAEPGTKKLTTDVFDAALDRSGSKRGEIAAKTEVPLDSIKPALDSYRQTVGRKIEDISKPAMAYLDELEALAAENGGKLPGTIFKEWNTELGADIRGRAGNQVGLQLSKLQDIVADGFRNQLSGEDRIAFDTAGAEYARAKSILPLVAKYGGEGNIPPAALLQALNATKSGKNRMAKGHGGEMEDLARAGQYLVDGKSSGTAERSAVHRFFLEPLTTAGKMAAALPVAAAYNLAGPAISRRMAAKSAKKEGGTPPPAAAAELTAEQSPFPQRGGGGEGAAKPLGDLTPDWETAPGATAARDRMEVVPTEGLVRALDEELPSTGSRKDVRSNLQMPAVEGRPDLPDTMVAGRPGEVAADAVSGAAMQTEDAALARQQQAPKPAKAAAPTPPSDPRLAEVERLRQEADSPAVRQALDAHEKTVKKTIEAETTKKQHAMDVDALEKAAQATQDPDLRAALQKRANTMREEKIPAGEVIEGQPEIKTEKPGKLPVGKVIEGQPDIKVENTGKVPTGKATEITPEIIDFDENVWRRDHSLGADDAVRATDVAKAFDLDPGAVEHAVRQHERSPRAFDKEIARIIEKGATNEAEAKQATGRGESTAAQQDRPGSTSSKPQQPGSDSVGKTRAERGEVAGARGQSTRSVDREGNEYDVSVKTEDFGADKKTKAVLVELRDPKTGERRGFVDFAIGEDGTLRAENAKVAPALQRKGLAELMYRAVRDAGHDIAPGRVQTDAGKKMVESLQKKGLINKNAPANTDKKPK